MPPKSKFTREEIIAAALEIARAEGIEAVTARALGDRLGSSARPIFTLFQSMEEVEQEVINAAKELYNQYVARGLLEIPAFKGVGTQYIRFAMEEPKLFQLLFMCEQKVVPVLEEVLILIDENYEKILESIREGYHLEGDEAKRLYRHLWIYTHGIATLCATRMCRFDEAEISEMMTEVCVSLLKKMKTQDNG